MWEGKVCVCERERKRERSFLQSCAKPNLCSAGVCVRESKRERARARARKSESESMGERREEKEQENEGVCVCVCEKRVCVNVYVGTQTHMHAVFTCASLSTFLQMTHKLFVSFILRTHTLILRARA